MREIQANIDRPMALQNYLAAHLSLHPARNPAQGAGKPRRAAPGHAPVPG